MSEWIRFGSGYMTRVDIHAKGIPIKTLEVTLDLDLDRVKQIKTLRDNPATGLRGDLVQVASGTTPYRTYTFTGDPPTLEGISEFDPEERVLKPVEPNGPQLPRQIMRHAEGLRDRFPKLWSNIEACFQQLTYRSSTIPPPAAAPIDTEDCSVWLAEDLSDGGEDSRESRTLDFDSIFPGWSEIEAQVISGVRKSREGPLSPDDITQYLEQWENVDDGRPTAECMDLPPDTGVTENPWTATDNMYTRALHASEEHDWSSIAVQIGEDSNVESVTLYVGDQEHIVYEFDCDGLYSIIQQRCEGLSSSRNLTCDDLPDQMMYLADELCEQLPESRGSINESFGRLCTLSIEGTATHIYETWGADYLDVESWARLNPGADYSQLERK